MLLVFQNKTNIEIIGFYLMHFGFALDSSDIDLWNTDLLGTYLDLLDTDIPKKHFVCLQNVFKTCLQDVFSVTIFRLPRRLEDVFSVTIFRLPRRLQDVLREVLKTSSRCLQDVLEDVKSLGWGRVEDVFKACLEDFFKTSWRPTNVCWVPWRE